MRLGIIDIGFNAIRAVVYHDSSIGAPEIFNNKFKNDILSLLEKEDLNIKHQTYLSLQYITHIFAKLSVTEVKCVATAVLRDHPKSEEFIKHIKATYDLNIEVISGDREAYLTALGLTSAIYNTDGIAADLGGGSLELAEVNGREINKLGSLNIGTKVINAKKLNNIDLIIKVITDEYGDFQYENIYMIGGALRFIGRLFLDYVNYPIKNLHNLTIDSKEFADYLEKIQNPNTNNEKNNKRKINYNAVIVTSAMIQVFKPKNIIISTFGLKEGVRFELLTKEEKQKDIIFEKLKQVCNCDTTKTDFDSYIKIISTLLPKENNVDDIIRYTIILTSLPRYFDHTLPPVAISNFVLYSEIPFPYYMRIMLALILSYMSNFKPTTELIKLSKKIINKRNHQISQIIGHTMRIAKDVDGAEFTTPSFSIQQKDGFLEIASNDILPRPIFEKVCDRLKSIAFIRKAFYSQNNDGNNQ
ncbi:MAG: Ppx/GppA family phosphatase [Rickettsiaceae bacterium]|nr:Ppx/GppA family phosphatase [Rickettsiaceae bacterium]